MSYTPVNWEDSPSSSTPITAENLNIMDKGIADVDKRTTEIETELPKKIKDENSVIGTNHILDGAITQNKIAEDLLKLILSGGGSSGGITYEQVKTLIESKEDISNKITTFDSLLTDKEKYPTAIAVINYLKDYYYNYEEIDGMLANLGGESLTTTQINALDAMFKKCAFTSNATAEYEAFKTAFGLTEGGETDEPDTPTDPDEPTITLSSISATYTGGEVVVGTSVNSLTGITVTATYSDGSTKNVTGYTLSGTIVEGNNTITVSYNGLTTTFTVVGYVEEEEPTYPEGVIYRLEDTVYDGTFGTDTGIRDELAETNDFTFAINMTDLASSQTLNARVFTLGTTNDEVTSLYLQNSYNLRVFGNTIILNFLKVADLTKPVRIVFTHTANSGTATIYVSYYNTSGELIVVNPVSGVYGFEKVGTENLYIGMKGSGFTQYLKATMNEFTIYSKVLSDEEISEYIGE